MTDDKFIVSDASIAGDGRIMFYTSTDYPGSIDYNYNPSIELDVDGEQVNLSAFIKSVKEALGQSPVIVKCTHCGQWGAKFCACRYCGAPVG